MDGALRRGQIPFTIDRRDTRLRALQGGYEHGAAACAFCVGNGEGACGRAGSGEFGDAKRAAIYRPVRSATSRLDGRG